MKQDRAIHHPSPERLAFGCVVDDKRIFHYQAARLLLSLRWNGGSLANAPLYVVFIGETSPDEEAFFDRHGALIHTAKPFDSDSGNAHIPSNKLRLFDIDSIERHDHLVLIDCDTIITRDPSEHLAVDGIGAKLADVPTITHQQLREVLRLLDIGKEPEPRYQYEIVDEATMGYFNSGVVCIAREWLHLITRTWIRHNRTLLAHRHDLPFPEFHLNQAALAATIADLEVPVREFPPAMNLPVHFAPERYPEHYHEVDPYIIHYHGLARTDGRIDALPLRRAAERAEQFNRRLQSHTRRRKPSRPGPAFAKAAKTGPKVIVGSGWWSDQRPHGWAKGAKLTTDGAFFDLWHRQVLHCIDPHGIVITDSRSPVKPQWRQFERVTWIELDRNYGHPNDVRVGNVKTKYSGFTRSVISGAMFALCCDADYYVYLEQDCLVRGADFVQHAIGDQNGEIFIGDPTQGGRGIEDRLAAPMYQQSCIIVARSALERFISGMLAGPETDGEMSPENKMARDVKPWETLAVPYGRSRPIDFSRSHFYVQHLQDDELKQFLRLEGLDEGFFFRRSEELFNLQVATVGNQSPPAPVTASAAKRP